MSACGRLYTFALPVLLVLVALACEVAYEPPPPQLTAMWSGTASAQTATAMATVTLTPSPTATSTTTPTPTSSIFELPQASGTSWIIEVPHGWVPGTPLAPVDFPTPTVTAEVTP